MQLLGKHFVSIKQKKYFYENLGLFGEELPKSYFICDFTKLLIHFLPIKVELFHNYIGRYIIYIMGFTFENTSATQGYYRG